MIQVINMKAAELCEEGRLFEEEKSQLTPRLNVNDT